MDYADDRKIIYIYIYIDDLQQRIKQSKEQSVAISEVQVNYLFYIFKYKSESNCGIDIRLVLSNMSSHQAHSFTKDHTQGPQASERVLDRKRFH